MQPPQETDEKVSPAPDRRRRVIFYRALGMLAVALAAIGAVVPLMPTTVFLLIALWAFARGSPEWAERVRANPRFGPYIQAWEARGAIPRRAKAMAVGMMAASWTLLLVVGQGVIVLGAVGGLLLAVSAFILTRPSN
ncbi:MAG: YbaN family protein [Pseudomonadota bacterium]